MKLTATDKAAAVKAGKTFNEQSADAEMMIVQGTMPDVWETSLRGWLLRSAKVALSNGSGNP